MSIRQLWFMNGTAHYPIVTGEATRASGGFPCHYGIRLLLPTRFTIRVLMWYFTGEELSLSVRRASGRVPPGRPPRMAP
jgi:hypothetical protein